MVRERKARETETFALGDNYGGNHLVLVITASPLSAGILVGGYFRVELVDHSRVRMTGEGGGDVRVDAGNKFASDPRVPEEILAVSNAELLFKASKSALHC